MSEDASIEELLQQTRSGDDAAKDELFKRSRCDLTLMARTQVKSWLRSKADESDLVQQTLADAHRALPAFRGRTELEWRAWLRQILLNNAAAMVRQFAAEKRRAGREVPLTPDRGEDSQAANCDPQAPGETPSAAALRQERELQVAEAVAQLPPDYQEVILSRNLEVYWFLISQGFRTYRFLPVFCLEFYPRWDQPTPPWAKALIDAFATAKFPDAYDADAGVVKASLRGYRLREGVGEAAPGRLKDPHVRFFFTQNPGHVEGDELCCLAPLRLDNCTAVARRMMASPRIAIPTLVVP